MDGLEDKLQDMVLHVEQYVPTILTLPNSSRAIIPLALESGQIDTEPYPYRSPQTRLDVPGNTGARLAYLEQFLDSYGLQTLQDNDGVLHLSRANPAGAVETQQFIADWLGSRHQWVLREGMVSYPQLDYISGNTQVHEFQLPTTYLDGVEGFIVIRLKVTPQTYDSRIPAAEVSPGYSLVPDGVEIIPEAIQTPPTRIMTFGGVSGAGTEYTIVEWAEGTYQIPLYYVRPPDATRKAPLIFPIVGWHKLIFQESRWVGSLPFL